MVSGRSAARATWYGLPLSSASSCASSSACFSMRSASLFIRFPRCAALIFRHGPLSNAARAAATALSTSAASASATCVVTSPVEGLIVGKVFPETLSTHFPLISSFVGPILTFDSITAAAVAIWISSFFRASSRAYVVSGLSHLFASRQYCREDRRFLQRWVRSKTLQAPPGTSLSRGEGYTRGQQEASSG